MRTAIAILAVAFLAVTPAAASPKEDALGVKIPCQDFQRGSDGQWISSPDTTIGTMPFGRHTFSIGDVDIGDADLATVLNRKCLAH
jgi:hypothetical protein